MGKQFKKIFFFGSKVNQLFKFTGKMYKRVPRTVKNSKNKEKELGSLNNNEIVESLPTKTRRRKTIEKKEVIRKPI